MERTPRTEGEVGDIFVVPSTILKDSKYPLQLNSYDCGVYTILYMVHLTLGDTINHVGVPRQYHIPADVPNLNGFRLLLLEEMESRRLLMSTV